MFLYTYIVTEYGKSVMAFSDDSVWIIFTPWLAHSTITNTVMQVRIGSKNSQNQITDFIFQAAVPKVPSNLYQRNI